MLTEEQKLTLEQSVRDVLQDFDQSGTAFTASTRLSPYGAAWAQTNVCLMSPV